MSDTTGKVKLPAWLPDYVHFTADWKYDKSCAGQRPCCHINGGAEKQECVQVIECKAAVAWEAKKPLQVTTVKVDPPWPWRSAHQGDLCLQYQKIGILMYACIADSESCILSIST